MLHYPVPVWAVLYWIGDPEIHQVSVESRRNCSGQNDIVRNRVRCLDWFSENCAHPENSGIKVAAIKSVFAGNSLPEGPFHNGLRRE